MWFIAIHIIWSGCSIAMSIESIIVKGNAFCYDDKHLYLQLAILVMGVVTTVYAMYGIVCLWHHTHRCPRIPRNIAADFNPVITSDSNTSNYSARMFSELTRRAELARQHSMRMAQRCRINLPQIENHHQPNFLQPSIPPPPPQPQPPTPQDNSHIPRNQASVQLPDYEYIELARYENLTTPF